MTSNATPIIEFKGVNKWYASNGYHVLRDVNLQFAKGEKVVICGPSGSGKSTLIRCINRLEAHQEGRIVVDGTELTDDLRTLDTIRSEVGMVFQSFNLFPHLTVLENCTLAPKLLAVYRTSNFTRSVRLVMRRSTLSNKSTSNGICHRKAQEPIRSWPPKLPP